MPGNAGGSEPCGAARLVEELSCAGAGKISISVIVGAGSMAREWTTFCDENATGGRPHSFWYATDWMGSLRYIAVCTRPYGTKGPALECSWLKPELSPEVSAVAFIVSMQLSQGKLELTDWNGNAAALASANIGCDDTTIDKAVRRFGQRLNTDVGLPRNIGKLRTIEACVKFQI